MSISSHLTPDPERRLWLIRDSTRRSLERSELVLAGLTALAAFQAVFIDDLARFTHAELVLRLDRYLGGGVTATQYYEDIISQIVSGARAAIRKRRLSRLAVLLVAGAELLLLAQLIHG